jgi:hypothetical protein
MSEEIKEEAVEEKVDGAEAEDEGEEVSLEDLEDDESEGEESKEEETDWKAVAEKQKERVRQLNGALKEERSKRKEAQKKEDSDEGEKEESNDEGNDIDARIQRAVREALAGNAPDTLEAVLESKVANPDKRELVKSLYETRITKTGNSRRAIEDDIELAILAADREAYQLNAKREARKEVAQKEVLKKSSMGVPSKAPTEAEHYSKEDRAIAREMKMDVKTYVKRKKQLEVLNR